MTAVEKVCWKLGLLLFYLKNEPANFFIAGLVHIYPAGYSHASARDCLELRLRNQGDTWPKRFDRSEVRPSGLPSL